MKIYTGTCDGDKKLDKIVQYNLGIMISPSPSFQPRTEWKERKIPCAFDNGAYQSYVRGFPFMESFFWDTLEKCYKKQIDLDFIVCPDIVAGGLQSLDFSCEWAEKLKTVQRLALPLQDGMMPQDITEDILCKFTHLFLGGTVDWKWQTMEQWSEFAKRERKSFHVARIGTSTKLKRCRYLGATSTDSTNMARNDSWKAIENYLGKELFE